jgi:hypothetical protein
MLDDSNFSGSGDSGGDDLTSPVSGQPYIPTQDTSAPPAPPDVFGANSVGALPPSPQDPSNPFTPPSNSQASGKPNVLNDVIMGALQGLAVGSQVRGRGGAGAAFGAGSGAALTAAQQADQRALVNQQNAQKLQFQSAEAATNIIKTRLDIANSARLDEEAKLKMDDHAVEVNNSREAADLPDLYVLNTRDGHYALAGGDADGQANPNDTSLDAQAQGALSVAAKANGGKIPLSGAVVSPHSDGSPGVQVGIFTTTPGQIASSPAKFDRIINESNRYDSPDAPDLSHADILAQGAQLNTKNPAAGVAQLATKAQQNLYNSVVPTGNPDKDAATSASLHQQLTNYQQAVDKIKQNNGGGGFTADDNAVRDGIVKALQARADSFDASMQSAQTNAAQAQADAAAKKASAEELAKNTGAAGQAQVNLAGAKAGAEAKAKAQYDDNLVVAYDPTFKNTDGSSGGNVVMPRGQAASQGLQHYKSDPSTINSTVAGFNDVQQKLDRLAAVATDPVQMAQVQHGIAADLIAGAGKGIKIGAFGAEVDMSNPNAQVYNSQLQRANQATRDFVTAEINAHEAMTQLPRLQTFGKSNRMTQQQMEAAQNLLPNAGDDAGMARQKMDAAQDILDPLRKQVPHMQGAELNPTWRDRQQAQVQPAQQPGATHYYDPASRTVKPFVRTVPNFGGNQ